MRREDALKHIDEFAFLAVSDAIALVTKIYDDFETVEHDLRCAIDHYIEQTSIYKGALDRANEKMKELEVPKTCETCVTHSYANSECDLLRYLPEFYRKDFGCVHHKVRD